MRINHLRGDNFICLKLPVVDAAVSDHNAEAAFCREGRSVCGDEKF
jgi:hypothetical protein